MYKITVIQCMVETGLYDDGSQYGYIVAVPVKKLSDLNKVKYETKA